MSLAGRMKVSQSKIKTRFIIVFCQNIFLKEFLHIIFLKFKSDLINSPFC